MSDKAREDDVSTVLQPSSQPSQGAQNLESRARSIALILTPIAVALVGPLFAFSEAIVESKSARDLKALELAVGILQSDPKSDSDVSNSHDEEQLRRWAAKELGFDDDIAEILTTTQLVEVPSSAAAALCQCYNGAFSLAGSDRTSESTAYRTGREQCIALLGIEGGNAWEAGWKARLSGDPTKASCRSYRERRNL